MSLRINSFAHEQQFSRIRENGGFEKSIQRLSSGLRINSGSDDAAGLSITEKLRSQIRGLNRALQNSQNAISMARTAEGGLSNIQDTLHRARELAIQSGSDANTAEDRLEIQKEVDALVQSIDKIASTTEFNQRKLLDGSAGAHTSASTTEVAIQALENSGEEARTGTYKVKVHGENAGVRQIQTSHTLRLRDSDQTARLSTRLRDTQAFAENIDYRQATLKLRGNRSMTTVELDTSMTIGEVEHKIERALKSSDGLSMERARFDFNEESSQFEMESGLSGNTGEISVFLSEDWTKAFGFETTQQSEEAVYRLEATTGGELKGQARGTTRGVEVVDGVQLDFEPPQPAETKIQLTHIAPDINPFTISIQSTNSHSGYIPGPGNASAPDAGTAVIDIAPQPGQNFGDLLQQISIQMNNTAPNMGLQLSIIGNEVFLVAPEQGGSSLLDITTNDAGAYLFSTQAEPPTHFEIAGTGGTAGNLTGSTNISGGYNSPVAFQLRFVDADGVRASSPTFGPGFVSYNDLMNQTNGALNAANAKIVLEDRLGNGTFQAYTTDTGDDTLFQMEVHVPERTLDVTSQIEFTIQDRDGGNIGPLPATQAVDIVIPTGTYGLNEIENIIQNQIQAVPAAQRPALTAKFIDDWDGRNRSGGAVRNGLDYRDGAGDIALAIQDDGWGTNSRVEVTNANGAAASLLGISNGVDTGSGGGRGRLYANRRMGASDELAPAAFDLRFVDDDGRETVINFPAGTNLSGNHGGTDLASFINANMGGTRIEAFYRNRNVWNLGRNTRQTRVAVNAPTPVPVQLQFQETVSVTTQTHNVTIPAGTNLNTFDWSTVNMGPLGMSLSNNGGRLRMEPASVSITTPYNHRVTVLNPAPQELNEAMAYMGMHPVFGSRIRFRSLDRGHDLQFSYQIQSANPADAQYISRQMFHINGSHGSIYGQAGYGRFSSAGNGTVTPSRAGNGDKIYDPGESPNWSDWRQNRRGRVVSSAYGFNRNQPRRTGAAAAGAGDVFRIRDDLGLNARQASVTSEAHNSGTMVFDSVPGVTAPDDLAAFAKIFPVPVTVIEGTEFDRFHVMLDSGKEISIPLYRQLPPDGLLIGRSMDELEAALDESLGTTNVEYELEKKTLKSRYAPSESETMPSLEFLWPRTRTATLLITRPIRAKGWRSLKSGWPKTLCTFKPEPTSPRSKNSISEV